MKLVKSLYDKTWIKQGDTCLFLGEIDNLKEHGAYVDSSGAIHYAYHIEDFIELKDEEL